LELGIAVTHYQHPFELDRGSRQRASEFPIPNSQFLYYYSPMRLFFAIPLAGPLRDALAALQAKLIETRAQVAWTDAAKFHLTIKFLGETDDSFVPELSARLTRAAAQVPAFPIDLDGLSAFPDRGPPRVIVAHAFSPDHRLTRLHRLIDSSTPPSAASASPWTPANSPPTSPSAACSPIAASTASSA
jgi:hypothetical protein